MIELALAMFVLAFGITTAITTLQRAFANLDTARSISTASAILQTQIEKERVFSWARVTDAAYQPTLDPVYLRNPDIAGRFTLTRSVAAVPDCGGQLVQVTLTVRWRAYDGRALARSYTTYFAQGGLNDFIATQS